MLKILSLPMLLFVLLCFGGCNETPVVVFHSYDELTDYPFFGADWVPEIVQNDITDIRETYAVENGHVYGRFDFVTRSMYDSVFSTYQVVSSDLLLQKMDSINRPQRPEWFITEKDLNTGKYQLAWHKGFCLLLCKQENRMYFVK
jgi:ABC-type polysaccharide transport system permease subunit